MRMNNPVCEVRQLKIIATKYPHIIRELPLHTPWSTDAAQNWSPINFNMFK